MKKIQKKTHRETGGRKAKKTKAVILAAGESSRFRPLSEGYHKSLTKLSGKELLRRTIESALKGGVDEIILVHGPSEEESFKNALTGLAENISFVLQPEPKGMGNALKHASEHIDAPFILLNADRYDAGDYVEPLIEKAGKTVSEMVLLCAPTDKPSKYGIAEFHGKQKDRIVGVKEKPKAGSEKSNQKIVGIYYLPQNFLEYYDRVKENQYALEDALDLYAKENDVRALFMDETPSSAKYAFDLLDSAKTILAKQKRKIAKSAVIEGNVVIGENTRIFENAVIKGPVYIGANCLIGNNSLIRENTILENGVQMGMNSEVTRSVILEGTHMHSGFIGDSVIGRDCRLGANFITANRRLDKANVKFMIKGELVDSGKSFLGTVLGHNVKVGINASTMPGTIIGSSCIIGSGTEARGTIESNRKVITKREVYIESRE